MCILLGNTKKPTKEQQDIINDPGNIAVIANPGSGKTFTIVEKIKEISTTLMSYQGIIAISFTNKASDELLYRCKSAGVNIKGSFFGTIDKFYIGQVIEPFARHLTKSIPEVKIKAKCEEIPEFSNLKKVQNDGHFDEPLLIASLKQGYIFLDICAETALYILKNVPAAKEYLQAKYVYVFIDEYQDCGAIQHEIFLMMVGLGIKGVAVGDINQAIYAFSNRFPQYLISLTQNPEFTPYSITRNHRCHKSISDYSLKLMGMKIDEISEEKRVYKISYIGDESVAAQHLNQTIVPIKTKYGITNNSQVAILCRGKGTIQRIIDSLTIPYKYYQETPLDTHNSYWARFFVDLLTSYFDPQIYCVDFADKYFYNEETYRKYIRFLESTKDLFDIPKTDLFKKADLMIKLARMVYPQNENQEAIDLLNEVLNDPILLENFIPPQKEQIVLMTYHKSKGLEFDIVFNMDVYEYVMPNYKYTQLDYEQMLNLHYVGITRAKQVCYIMQGTVRHKANGTPIQTKESQFLYLNGVERYRIDKNWN